MMTLKANKDNISKKRLCRENLTEQPLQLNTESKPNILAFQQYSCYQGLRSVLLIHAHTYTRTEYFSI